MTDHPLRKTILLSFIVTTITACGGGGQSTSSSSNSDDNTNDNPPPFTISEETFTWSPPGGNATINHSEKDPFLTISDNIEDSEISSISQGRELFIADWLVAPGSRKTLDGVGPLLNATACTSCHVNDGRVPPILSEGKIDNSFLFRLGNESGQEHPQFGGQLQTQATAGLAEGQVTWSIDEISNLILYSSTPDFSAQGFRLGPRIAPHLLGMGLLDLVTEETILEYADPTDTNNDGISGRAHWVEEEGQTRIGRFGWKAINSTLRTQNAGAMHQDMGLTSPVNPTENCTDQQFICTDEPNGGYPEVSETSLVAIVNFMTALGVPDRRINNQTNFDKGANIFKSIGCAACHRPTMTTGQSQKFAHLSGQTIYPYTDLLLHDMGDALNDRVKEKQAMPEEWRTPPLWGLGIVESKAGARFLHDGSAATIDEAIQQHGGEAQQAKSNYLLLTEKQNSDLLEFLRGI